MNLAEDFDVRQRVHTILGQYMKDKEANKVIQLLNAIMVDEEDGPEFVRLMQKWIHIV